MCKAVRGAGLGGLFRKILLCVLPRPVQVRRVRQSVVPQTAGVRLPFGLRRHQYRSDLKQTGSTLDSFSSVVVPSYRHERLPWYIRRGLFPTPIIP